METDPEQLCMKNINHTRIRLIEEILTLMFRSSHIFVFCFFYILVTLVAWFSFFVFLPCPSCLAKCKHRLCNILVFSYLHCQKWPKTKYGMNETLVSGLLNHEPLVHGWMQSSSFSWSTYRQLTLFLRASKNSY